MADRLGQHLGNYRLTRCLGQGGFADVYLGEHLHLGTQVAIKVLQMRLIGSNMEMFHHEAQTVASLVHPHIVRILDFGVENGIPFLVMDYAPHGTLRQRHPRGSRLSAVSIVPYVRQVAVALQYAHDRKLIHRDIKPENMLLGLDENVLLSDFGLVLMAQSTSTQTTKEMAGTLPYMAPEQINGKPRIASDQYSLGIVIYEWLSGYCPFRGAFVEIATQHLMTPPAPLYGRIPNVSLALEEVIFTALAKDPHERFASMLAFATAFEQAAQAIPSDPLLVSQTMRLSSELALSTSVDPALDQSVQPPLTGGPAPSRLSPAGMVNTSLGPSSQSTLLDQSSQSTVVRTPLSSSSQSAFAFAPPPTAVIPASTGNELFKQDLSSSLQRKHRPVDIAVQATFVSKSVAPQEQSDRSTPLSAQAFPAPMQARPRWWLVALLIVLVVLLIGGGSVVVGNPLFRRMNLTATASVLATPRPNLPATPGLNPAATPRPTPTSVAARSAVQVIPTATPTPTATLSPQPPTSVMLSVSASGISPTTQSELTIHSGTKVTLTVQPNHSLLPFQTYTMGIYATDPYDYSELQYCQYPNTATCSWIVAYSSSENTDYTKGKHTFIAFLGDIGGRILANSNSVTITWS